MKIREWIKLRKQNDMVKLAVIFLALGNAFFLAALFQGIEFANSRKESTEYVLSKAGRIEEKDIAAVSSLENVSGVSRELEEPVRIKWKEKQTEVSSVIVSREYIEKLYGISCKGNTRTFYINKAAFEMINGELFLYEGDSVDNDSFPVSIVQNDETGEKVKKARLVVAEDQIHKEEPFVCTYGDELTLQHNALSIRVLLEQKNLDGTERKRFERLGFSVQNEEKITAWEYEIKLWMLKMKYDILIAALCLVSGGAMLKGGKQIWGSQNSKNNK